ncbi:MAG: 4Fe-4S binding protein [Anaerolineaceae bacterium]|nr:MAG: 4Fe-4S binding protein [Anaerolineaceae bacterium]
MKHIINLVRLLFLGIFIFLLVVGKNILWFGVFGLSLILAVVFGRLYCGYACPMNTLMLPTDWIAKKLNIQTDKMPKWLSSGKFGWVTLIGSIAIMILSKRVLHKNIPILLIWIVVAILITLRYKTAVFHNLICPFGVLQKTFGKFAIFSERVDKSECIGCKKCEKVCPSTAITVNKSDKKAEIKTSLCFQCTNCVQVCPTDCIHYSRNK